MPNPPYSGDLLRELAEQVMQRDEVSLHDEYQALKPLEDLCKSILRERQRFQALAKAADSILREQDWFEDRFRSSADTLSYMAEWNKSMEKCIGGAAAAFIGVADRYEAEVKGLKTNSQDQYQAAAAMAKAIHGLDLIGAHAINNYVQYKLNLQPLVDKLKKFAGRYNTYLRARFVKEEQKDDPTERLRIVRNRDMSGFYIKIRLIDDNSVLTDALLGVAKMLPHYHVRRIKHGKSVKPVRELSETELNDLTF